MSKYSIAINSLAFIVSIILGILIINHTLKPSSIIDPTQAGETIRIVNIGEIYKMKPDSFSFKYFYDSKLWYIEIKITEDTRFHTSKILKENNVIYGREVTISKRSDLSIGKKAVVDWKFSGEKGAVATDIIFVEPGASSLLY